MRPSRAFDWLEEYFKAFIVRLWRYRFAERRYSGVATSSAVELCQNQQPSSSQNDITYRFVARLERIVLDIAIIILKLGKVLIAHLRHWSLSMRSLLWKFVRDRNISRCTDLTVAVSRYSLIHIEALVLCSACNLVVSHTCECDEKGDGAAGLARV